MLGKFAGEVYRNPLSHEPVLAGCAPATNGNGERNGKTNGNGNGKKNGNGIRNGVQKPMPEIVFMDV